MSNIRVNAITDEAGTGAPDFPNGYTVAGAVPAAGFSYAAVSGATQALDVGAHNFFDAGTLTADTTISFTNVPTEAQWTYTTDPGIAEVYTLASATYASLSKSVTAQDANPFGLAFSSDGTKMFIGGTTTGTVYQYTLSTAWNVSTATYASLSKSVAAQDANLYGLAFSSDGTKMFIVGNASDTIYQYTLSTAWNVSTATYASLSKSVAAQETNPLGLAFSSDGTKMFVVGATNDTVYQYPLSTAWNVSTATYTSLSKSVAAQDTTPYTLAFSSDGTKLFLLGGLSDTVYQYNTSGPFGITTPASIQNPPSSSFQAGNQVAYTFFTSDAGTTVKLINEQVL